jgi:hypothetical protein
MNLSSGGIITILLVITAVLFAGCTSQDEPVVPEQVQQTITPVSTSYGTTAITMVHQPVTTVQTTATESTAKVFNGEYHWAEYRENNTITLPPNPRYQWEYVMKVERSPESYKGSPAVHYKITQVSDYAEWIDHELVTTKDGWIFVDDSYYDASTNKFLMEITAETIKGISQPAPDSSAYYSQHYREDCPAGWLGITPFGEMNISLTDEGTESVTVPAGTYPDARKYSGNFKDGTPITFWVVPGIPVPVQYQFPNKDLGGVDPFQSYELKGWG